MRRQHRSILFCFLAVLFIALLFWRGCRKARTTPAVLIPPVAVPLPSLPVVPATHKPAPGVSRPSVPAVPKPAVAPAVVPVIPSTAPIAPANVPMPEIAAPSQEGLHKELIPKNISIERIYYEQDVAAPGTSFGFDINGSGFDAAFQQSIAVDFDALDVESQNMRLVTANQIHGTVQVGEAATTQYISPKILIRGLPVFRATDPFGVVRPGEVLDIQLTNIDETGQTGEFRVITNLDAAQYKRFHVAPTTPRLELSDLSTHLPFYVDGFLRISQGLSSGEYGVTASLGSHLLLRKDPLVDVVRPDVGRTGTIETVKAEQPATRPGDVLQLIVHGSGFTSNAVASLSGKIPGFDMGPGRASYVSASELRMSFDVPMTAPNGIYGVELTQKGKTVYARKTVFAIVPPNWLNRVKLSEPVHPGGHGVVQLTGREISPNFVQGLKIIADEPGLKIELPRLQDPSTIAFDLSVSTDVAAGDYILHIFFGDQPLKLPGGNIIKITD